MIQTLTRALPALREARVKAGLRALALTSLGAAVTAAGAQAAFHTPFTPVPITFQTLCVLLSGWMLGSRLGALSQVEYLALGMMGLPVFAGGTAGPAAFVGASGGYLPGFVLAAWLVGRLTEQMRQPGAVKRFAAMLAGVFAIYIPGILWLAVWLHATTANGNGLLHAALLGIVPFLAVDALKAALAAEIGGRLRRRF
ncbi:MAG TPA: biotin transporter BioY [Armatimonadota bacterium]|nr:biotin transporter BioY [Armatimonadota bacterium]